MWTTFWLNNLHFALEFFGSLVFFVATWLFLDTFLLRREVKILLRCLGFFLLAIYGVVHAAGTNFELALWGALLAYLLGLVMLVLSLVLDVPPKMPTLAVVLVIPGISQALPAIYVAATALLAIASVIAVRRYRQESAKSLGAFCLAFALFAAASYLSLYSDGQAYGNFWVAEHLIKLVGYCSLGVWVWQYLRFRIKEELLLVFIAMALGIAILVTFTFSALLLGKMERDSESNLATSIRVVDYAIDKVKRKTASDAKLVAGDTRIQQALASKNNGRLEQIAQQSMRSMEVDFLTIADEQGNVVLRAHAATQVGDSIASEQAGSLALSGKSVVRVEYTAVEKFSIRGAAPIRRGAKLAGVIITGKIVDNSLVDEVRRVTGLETTIFQGDKAVATTFTTPDGRTRSVGTRLSDAQVIQQVLGKGKGFVGRTTISNRPFLAAYLPLFDGGDRVVGMLSVGRPQVEVLQAASSTNRLTLFVTITLMIVTILPAYFVARNISEQV